MILILVELHLHGILFFQLTSSRVSSLIHYIVFLLAATAMPEAEFLEHDSAIWSLDVEPEGNLAVSGAEDGMVSCI